MAAWVALLVAAAANAFLVAQMLSSRTLVEAPHSQSTARVIREDVLERRAVSPGERKVLELSTTGLVEVVVYEHDGDPESLARLQAGQIPRNARVFQSVRELSYPLSSVAGAEFYVRVRHLQPGQTSLQYRPGTVDQAMGRLRKGHNLVRNRGTLLAQGRLFAPVYQLVPGTILRVEVRSGRGTVGVLKTREFLDVRDGRVPLQARCTPCTCVDPSSGRSSLQLMITDYDDRYLVADGQDLVFTYEVVATPEVLNYISSCT